MSYNTHHNRRSPNDYVPVSSSIVSLRMLPPPRPPEARQAREESAAVLHSSRIRIEMNLNVFWFQALKRKLNRTSVYSN